MVKEVFDLIYITMNNFNNSIFVPLLTYFDLRELLILLFGVVLTVRFLLMPLLGYRFINTAGSDTANVPKRQQLRLEDKGGK